MAVTDYLLIAGIVVGVTLPFVVQAGVLRQRDRRGGSRYVAESLDPWANLLKFLVWLVTGIAVGAGGAFLAGVAFARGSPAWSFTVGFGIGLGSTILIPFYEVWLRRQRRRDPTPTDEEIDAMAADDK